VLRLSSRSGAPAPGPLFSEKVTIDFKESSDVQHAALQDPKLPMLCSVLNVCRPDEKPENFCTTGRHATGLAADVSQYERPFQELSHDINALPATGGVISEKLLTYLKASL
jgi:hypothetical protein